MLPAVRGREPRGGRGAIRYVQMGYAVERGGVEETAPYIPLDTYSQTTYVYATKTHIARPPTCMLPKRPFTKTRTKISSTYNAT